MNEALIPEIRRNLQSRSTETLLEMLRRGDTSAWSPEAFAAALAVLVDRGVTEFPSLPVVDERGGRKGVVRLILSAFLVAVIVILGYHWLSVAMIGEPLRELNQSVFEAGVQMGRYKAGMTREDLEAALGKPARVVREVGRDGGEHVPALAAGQEDLWWPGAASGENAMGARLGPDGKTIYFLREKVTGR